MPPSAESIDSAVQPLSVPNRSAVKLLALRETGQQVKGCLPRFKVPVLCLHGVNDCFVLGGMLSNLQSDGSLTNVILIGCNTRSLLYIGGTPALWQGLTHLTITHSPLSSIAGISQAPQLQHLDLRANQLTALEITMQLKRCEMGLKCLDLRGNPGLTGTAICATLIAGPRLLAPVAHLNGERVGHASAIAEWLVFQTPDDCEIERVPAEDLCRCLSRLAHGPMGPPGFAEFADNPF